MVTGGMASDATRGTLWSDKQVRALTPIWGESNIQEELDGAVRNKVVYQEISRKLLQQGYYRDWEDKNQQLKRRIQNCEGSQWRDGERQEDMQVLQKLDGILGHHPVSVTPAVLDTGNSRSNNRVNENSPVEKETNGTMMTSLLMKFV